MTSPPDIEVPKPALQRSGAPSGSSTDAQLSQLGKLDELPDIAMQSQAKAVPLNDVVYQLKLERAAEILKRQIGVQGSSPAEVLDAACHELRVHPETAGLRLSDVDRMGRCFEKLRLEKEWKSLALDQNLQA